MNIGELTDLLQEGIFEVLVLALPLLLTALFVGLFVAILQATTSIQEQTLTFVPKIVAILLMLALLGSWMFARLGNYTLRLFAKIPEMAQ